MSLRLTISELGAFLRAYCVGDMQLREMERYPLIWGRTWLYSLSKLNAKGLLKLLNSLLRATTMRKEYLWYIMAG